jgi:hypothetical protein
MLGFHIGVEGNIAFGRAVTFFVAVEAPLVVKS